MWSALPGREAEEMMQDRNKQLLMVDRPQALTCRSGLSKTKSSALRQSCPEGHPLALPPCNQPGIEHHELWQNPSGLPAVNLAVRQLLQTKARRRMGLAVYIICSWRNLSLSRVGKSKEEGDASLLAARI